MSSSPSPLAATGVEGLDNILRGGLPRRRIYLLQGLPGVGKTTLGLQFLLEGKRLGETGLYVTLSETGEELAAVAASHGWDLDGLNLHQLSSLEEQQQALTQNTLFHPAEVELNETINKVMAVLERVRPERVVFDSLSEMRLLAGDSLRYRRKILALKQHFTGRDSTVLFLDDDAGERGDLQLQSLAHGVISLERSAPAYGATRRRLEVVKLRGVDFRGGKHDCTITRGGLRVFPRLVAAEHLADFPRGTLASGVEALDALLGGGLERGTSTLLLGPAGAGKSSIAAQYIHAALERGEHVAMFTFDENLATLHARTAGLGLDLRAHVEAGRLSLRQVDPAELSPGEFAHAVVQAVEHAKARVVVIDSLNGYLMAMPDERFLELQMHELLSYLGHQGVTSLLVVAQHGLVGTMQAPVDLTYLADTVVLLRYFEAGGKLRKALSVLKKRVGTHEDTLREVQFGGGGIRVGVPLSDFRGILSGTPAAAPRASAQLLPEED